LSKSHLEKGEKKMKTADGVKIIYRCDVCGRIKPFDQWVKATPAEQKAVYDQGHIAFIQSVCPNCERKK